MARTTATIAAIVLASTLTAAAPTLPEATDPFEDSPSRADPSVTSLGPGEPLSEPQLFYTQEMHQKVIEATEQGKAYNIAVDAKVNFSAGQFIQPGRPLYLENEETCTLGFVLGTPGNYAITTAAHCVENEDEINMPLQSNQANLVNIGKVTDVPENPNIETNDWAVIKINQRFQGNVGSEQNKVDPGVLGMRSPGSGAYEVPHQVNGSPAAGWTWPMPVLMVSHQPSDEGEAGAPQLVTTTQTPVWGWLVEEHDGRYLCECPVTPGDSGGPVVVFTPEHPRGAALGLVSTSAERLTGYTPPDLYGDITKDLERGRGKHELAAITPMSTVIAGSSNYDQVATASATSTADPCAVHQAGSGGSARDVTECYHWYWPDPSNPCAGYTVEECVDELVHIQCETCPSDVTAAPSLPVDPPDAPAPSPPEAPG